MSSRSSEGSGVHAPIIISELAGADEGQEGRDGLFDAHNERAEPISLWCVCVCVGGG
jgi:hypothetical protein